MDRTRLASVLGLLVVLSAVVATPGVSALAAGGGSAAPAKVGLAARPPASLVMGYPYRFRNAHSNKCLTVHNVSTADNAPVVQYECDWDHPYNETWYFIEAGFVNGNRTYYIKNGFTAKCLTIYGASLLNDAAAVQYTCDTTAPYNERWYYFYFPETDSYSFQNAHSNKTLTIWIASFDNNAAAIQYTTETNPPYNERWKIID